MVQLAREHINASNRKRPWIIDIGLANTQFAALLPSRHDFYLDVQQRWNNTNKYRAQADSTHLHLNSNTSLNSAGTKDIAMISLGVGVIYFYEIKKQSTAT